MGKRNARSVTGPFEFEWKRPQFLGLVRSGECVALRPARFVLGSGILAREVPGPFPQGPWLVTNHWSKPTSLLENDTTLHDILSCDLSDEGILGVARRHGFLGRFRCDILVNPDEANDAADAGLFGPTIPGLRRPNHVFRRRDLLRDRRVCAIAEPVEPWRSEIVRVQVLYHVWNAIRTIPSKGSAKFIEASQQAQTLVSFVGGAVEHEDWNGWQRSGNFSIPSKLGLPAPWAAQSAPPPFDRSYAVQWAIDSGAKRSGQQGIPTSEMARWSKIDKLKKVASYALIEQLNIALAEGSNFALLPNRLNALRLAPADLLGWVYLRLSETVRGKATPSFKKCDSPQCPEYFPWRSNKLYCDDDCRDKARNHREREARTTDVL
ncbi:MAG: hypothetical protein JSS66_14615 [Armatimonadetes bacterium]|nr:hypothetical protein [Armatimonadota bacterium]